MDPEVFDKATVEDAEKLLSYHVAASMQRNGYDMEADYVSTIATWEEENRYVLVNFIGMLN